MRQQNYETTLKRIVKRAEKAIADGLTPGQTSKIARLRNYLRTITEVAQMAQAAIDEPPKPATPEEAMAAVEEGTVNG